MFIIQSKHSLSSRLLSKNLKIKIYKTIILPVFLYGWETWSLTLREEECKLSVFENRTLRRIFGSKRDENGEWRSLHNEEIHSLYYSPNIVRVIKSRRLRQGGYVARIEEILKGRPIGKRPLGRSRRRWEDNIRMVLKGIGVSTRKWIDSAKDRDQWSAFVNAAFNLLVL